MSVLPKFVYIVMKINKHQFKKGDAIEAIRSKGPKGGWVTRMDIRHIAPSEAYEPEPGQRGSGKVEKYIRREYETEKKE